MMATSHNPFVSITRSDINEPNDHRDVPIVNVDKPEEKVPEEDPDYEPLVQDEP
jgi:hypothetical protein